MEFSCKKFDNDGYNYSKKRLRLKLFGIGLMEFVSSSKKMKMFEDLCIKKVEEFIVDIVSFEDRMRLL